MTDIQAAQQTLTAVKYREYFFQKEADPLFNKWKRKEATEDQWLAKIEEIRNRFPYSETFSPEEAQEFMDSLAEAS